MTNINNNNHISKSFEDEGYQDVTVSKNYNIDKMFHHAELLNKIVSMVKPVCTTDIKADVLSWLLFNIEQELDLEKKEKLQKKYDRHKLTDKDFIGWTIYHIKNHVDSIYGIRHIKGSTYFYNGNYWDIISKESISDFLRNYSITLGLDRYSVSLSTYMKLLYDSFIGLIHKDNIEPESKKVLLNVQNGTIEISATGDVTLRDFNKDDFLTYQLSYSYNKEAKAPTFNSFLNKSLPDPIVRMVLMEYLGFIFVKHSSKMLNLHKTLLLYGEGSNGKSVVFDVVTDLLGKQNITNFGIGNLTDPTNGTSRAQVEYKLLNYSSELDNNLNIPIFKQLCSGEAVEARKMYNDPYQIYDYAKMMFNCNKLPKDTENTRAYFRRFIIIPFDVTIQAHEKINNLAELIIKDELPGVLNLAIEGLQRLIKQQDFTESKIINETLSKYQKESDNVAMFLEDFLINDQLQTEYKASILYSEYATFCKDNGYKANSNTNFGKRMANLGYDKIRKMEGYFYYFEKEIVDF
jgi:putative DNA primase/helicase